MAYGENWSGVGPNYQPPSSSAGRQSGGMLDPALGNIPGIGDYIKYGFDPSVGLEDWLNRLYIPPGLKALLRGTLPRLLRANLGRQAAGFSQGQTMAQMADTLAGGGFKQYLATLDPFQLLRDLQGENNSPQFQQAVQGRQPMSGAAGQGGGTRRWAY